MGIVVHSADIAYCAYDKRLQKLWGSSFGKEYGTQLAREKELKIDKLVANYTIVNGNYNSPKKKEKENKEKKGYMEGIIHPLYKALSRYTKDDTFITNVESLMKLKK